jgi:hypothetical protein
MRMDYVALQLLYTVPFFYTYIFPIFTSHAFSKSSGFSSKLFKIYIFEQIHTYTTHKLMTGRNTV